MYVCMYVCKHVYMHVCMHGCMYVNKSLFINLRPELRNDAPAWHRHFHHHIGSVVPIWYLRSENALQVNLVCTRLLYTYTSMGYIIGDTPIFIIHTNSLLYTYIQGCRVTLTQCLYCLSREVKCETN